MCVIANPIDGNATVGKQTESSDADTSNLTEVSPNNRINVVSVSSKSRETSSSSSRSSSCSSCSRSSSAESNTDSDDTEVDPNFTNSSSSTSTTSSDSNPDSGSDNEANNTTPMVRKVLFPKNESKTTRKRRRCVDQWQKNSAKAFRNHGQSYEVTKKIKKVDGSIETVLIKKDARKMLPPCGDKCRQKCSMKFSHTEREDIFKAYWNLGNLQRQRDFIAANVMTIKPKYRYQKEDSNRRLNTGCYLTRNGCKERVCKQFFVATLGISTRVLRTVEEKRLSSGDLNVVSPDKRGKHGNHATVSADVKEGIRNHIRKIPVIESHYTRAKSSKSYISGDKTIMELFRDYQKMCEEHNIEQGNYIMYRHIFNYEFNYAFFTPKKDLCELCSQFSNAAEDEKKKLIENYEAHIREKELSRIEKENDKKSNSEVAVFDLQAVLPCPRGDVSSFYYVSKLNVLNFTIVDLKTMAVNCYVWHEGQANRGANEIATCVWRYLEELHKRVADQSPSNKGVDVVFYSDNCAGQNKNRNLIAMYRAALMTFDSINTITHKFLITGRTQNEGDSAHSVIEREIKKARKASPIYVPEQYVSLIRSAKKTGKPYSVHEMCYKDFYEFKTIELKRKNSDNEVFKISNVKVLKLESSTLDRVYYKNSFREETFQTVLLNSLPFTRKRSPGKEELKKPSYTSKKGISEEKKKGLLRLLERNIIPSFYLDFYNNL